jgi:CRP-like cAMP-binding protein
MDAAEFLKRTALFASFTDKEIARVIAGSKERQFDEGAPIVEEGDQGWGFYLILEGSAQVRKGDTVLADFGPGDYFGEMALLLDDTPRTADVLATAPTRCIVITQWDLRGMVQAHPEIGVRIMGELARRLRDTDAKIAD